MKMKKILKNLFESTSFILIIVMIFSLIGFMPINKAYADENKMESINSEALQTVSNGEKKVKEVSLSTINSAAILEDGSLWMWGDNSRSQLGDGTTEERHSPEQVKELSSVRVKKVVLKNNNCAALAEDGSLYMWGENFHGEVGNSTKCVRQQTPCKILDSVKEVVLGNGMSAAIQNNGDLYMWGTKAALLLGEDFYENGMIKPKLVMNSVKQIALGPDACAAIKEDGTLWTWGKNENGELGDADQPEARYRPDHIMTSVKYVALCGSGTMSGGGVWRGDTRRWNSYNVG